MLTSSLDEYPFFGVPTRAIDSTTFAKPRSSRTPTRQRSPRPQGTQGRGVSSDDPDQMQIDGPAGEGFGGDEDEDDQRTVTSMNTARGKGGSLPTNPTLNFRKFELEQPEFAAQVKEYNRQTELIVKNHQTFPRFPDPPIVAELRRRTGGSPL